MKLDLSILVVTYRNARMVAAFHQSLCHSLAPHDNWELLYRDHTPDSSVLDVLRRSPCPPQHLSQDSGNPGFAHGVNHLLKQAQNHHIVLLNPDVSGFSPAFWETLLKAHTDNQVLFIRLRDAFGQAQDCVGRQLSLKRALTLGPDYAALNEPVRVDNGIMAFMLTDRSTFERVGQLDEDYPLYAEDMDWCYRARQKDIALIYEPRLELRHTGGASADTRMGKREQRLAKYHAERIFIDKHFHGIQRWTLQLANRIKCLWAA